MKIYYKGTELQKVFGCGKTWIQKRINGIRREVRNGRYNQYAFVGKMVHIGVFLDFCSWYEMLSNENERKYVPDFDVGTALEYCGKRTEVEEYETE